MVVRTPTEWHFSVREKSAQYGKYTDTSPVAQIAKLGENNKVVQNNFNSACAVDGPRCSEIKIKRHYEISARVCVCMYLCACVNSCALAQCGCLLWTRLITWPNAFRNKEPHRTLCCNHACDACLLPSTSLTNMSITRTNPKL